MNMDEQNMTMKNVSVREEEPQMSLQDIFIFVMRKWYWFAISVIACLTIAAIYLMLTPKIYNMTASVLVKDSRMNPTETALFQDLDFFEGTKNVNNEVIIFKSYKIMSEAVRRLRLDISYTAKKGIMTSELYTNSPISFVFIDADESQSYFLKSQLLSNNQITIWDIQTFGTKSTQKIVANLNDTIYTPAGRIVAIPTLWNNEEWLGKTITVRKSSLKSVANKYRSEIKVDAANKITAVINLSIKDASTQRAEDLLNTIIAIYNEEAISYKNAMAIDTEKFINDRLLIIKEELGDVDDEIKSYKKANQLTYIQNDVQLALQEGSESDKKIIALQNQLSMATYIRNYLSDPSNIAELIPSGAGVDEVNIESQILSYNQTFLERTRLIENSSERNTVVQGLNNKLNAMRQNIMRAVDNLIVNLDIQLSSAIAQTKSTKARISAAPQQQADVTSISRQQQIKEQPYLYLLTKREENLLNKAITQNTARIIDPATSSSEPVAPRSLIIMIAALFIGLFIPAAALYVLMIFDITIRNSKDLTSILSIPFLGEVPFKKIKGKDKKSINGIFVRENGRDPVSEAFRIIRTNMDFMRVKRDIKVITTTSADAGAGKTFISFNLAVSLAMTGKKVLLIDMDLRKGTLGKNLNSSQNGDSIGLTNYLSEKRTSIESLIVKDKNYNNIDIMHSGSVPPNPAELLLSSRLDELINELKNLYDFIIIDNVPTGMIADAMISNRITDITLYIIRAGKTDRRLLSDIEQLYSDTKLKNMALILNGTEVRKAYDIYKYR